MFIRPINNTRDGFNFVKRIKTSGSTEKLIDLFNRLSSLFDRYRIYSKYPVKSVCQRIRYTPNEALIFHQFCQTYCPDIHIRRYRSEILRIFGEEEEGKELADRNGFRTVLEKGVRR